MKEQSMFIVVYCVTKFHILIRRSLPWIWCSFAINIKNESRTKLCILGCICECGKHNFFLINVLVLYINWFTALISQTYYLKFCSTTLHRSVQVLKKTQLKYSFSITMYRQWLNNNMFSQWKLFYTSYGLFSDETVCYERTMYRIIIARRVVYS